MMRSRNVVATICAAIVVVTLLLLFLLAPPELKNEVMDAPILKTAHAYPGNPWSPLQESLPLKG